MRLFLSIIFGFFLCSICFAQPRITYSPLNIEEQDGSPSTFPYKLKVTNGTLTDNGDNTSSLSVQSALTFPISITNGGTNNSSAYTSGSVIFSNGTSLTQNNANLFWDNTNSRLGIGTATPGWLLDITKSVAGDIVGDIYNSSLTGYGLLVRTAASNSTQYELEVRGNTSRADLTVLSNGNVGIGQNAPATSLHVVSSDTNWGGSLLENTTNTSVSTFSTLQNVRRVNTAGAGVGFAQSMYDSLSTIQEYGYVGAIIESNTAGSQSGSIVFDPRKNNVRTEAVRILSSGNVGIGTTAPAALLTIAGHVHTRQTAPTVANNDCGTTIQGTITSKSTDISGSITIGTLNVTSCAITFNGTWTNAPNCVVTDDTNIIALRASATTTKLTIFSAASMSSDVVTYICLGNE